MTKVNNSPSYFERFIRTFQEDKNVKTKSDLPEYFAKTTLASSLNTAVVKAVANHFLPLNKLMIYLTLPVIFQLVPHTYHALDINWRPINMEDCKKFMRGIPIDIVNSLIIAGLIYANGELNSQFQTEENSELAKKYIDLAVGIGLGLVGIPLMDLVAAAIKAINHNNSSNSDSNPEISNVYFGIDTPNSLATSIDENDLSERENDEMPINNHELKNNDEV